MCDFTGSVFGASYPDAVCIEGYLWDADSYEDGFLTSGGDTACPQCNTANSLEGIREDLINWVPQTTQPDDLPAQAWERSVLRALELNQDAATLYLRGLSAFEILDRDQRVAGPSRPWDEADEDDPDDLVWRLWPWPVKGMSQHNRLAIYPRSSST